MKFVRQSIPTDKQGQENLLRSLMNVRPPRPISNDFLKIQDEYLTERNIERGITDVDTLAPVKFDLRLYIWQGDITTLRCDAIVKCLQLTDAWLFFRRCMPVLITLFILMLEWNFV